MPSARLRRNVFHLCGRGTLLRAIYLATLVWPMLTPSLRSSPWKRGAPHNGLAMLISRISRRISNGAVGRPQRRHDFQRQYNLKPARRQRITVSGFTIRIFGKYESCFMPVRQCGGGFWSKLLRRQYGRFGETRPLGVSLNSTSLSCAKLATSGSAAPPSARASGPIEPVLMMGSKRPRRSSVS
jgi:hypothetical protein